MYSKFKTYLLVALVCSSACALPSYSQEKISNFVALTDESSHFPGCIIGPSRKPPSDTVLESELFQWLLNCRNRLEEAAKSTPALKASGSSLFRADLDMNTGSASLRLEHSSGSKLFDQRAENIIKYAIPFKRPFNDLPYRRGLLIEINQSGANIKLASK
ncbi:MAG: hypothetical protein J0H83_17845 [Candidatus Melainabacteria bacterium]|jgi:hypothetical protein|nr:hypothetical protein [Candidatus Melainabacteria bacterium]